MTVDTLQIGHVRLMRDHIGAALKVAVSVDDTLLAALLADIEHTLTGRIAALVSPNDAQLSPPDASARFTSETGYGRAAAGPAAQIAGIPRP